MIGPIGRDWVPALGRVPGLCGFVAARTTQPVAAARSGLPVDTGFADAKRWPLAEAVRSAIYELMAKKAEPGAPTAFATARTRVLHALIDDAGIERPIERDSKLAREISASMHDVAQHFLGELPHHCTMLAVAVADALASLDRLDGELPFGAIVLVRGLAECAADLYWLSDPEIDGSERARRAFLVYLSQEETVVRQLEQLSKRVPPEIHKIPDLPEAIAEGWESLNRHAEEMAAAGYRLRTTNKPGSKYILGDAKPSISALIDGLIVDQLGKTALNLYTSYSPIAHGDGEGLGSLLTRSATVETPDGTRYRRGFDEQMWDERIRSPATRAATGSVGAWVELAYPSRSAMFRGRS